MTMKNIIRKPVVYISKREFLINLEIIAYAVIDEHEKDEIDFYELLSLAFHIADEYIYRKYRKTEFHDKLNIYNSELAYSSMFLSQSMLLDYPLSMNVFLEWSKNYKVKDIAKSMLHFFKYNIPFESLYSKLYYRLNDDVMKQLFKVIISNDCLKCNEDKMLALIE